MERKSVFRLRTALALAAGLLACGAAQAASLADLSSGAGSKGLTFLEAQSRMRGGSDLLRASESEAIAREMQAEADKSLSGPKVSFNARMIWGSKTLDYGELNLGEAI